MNRIHRKYWLSIFLLCFLSAVIVAGDEKIETVTPDASVETKALLELMYNISGKFMLTGQHNYPNTRDKNSQFASRYIGKTPVVWSTDMGFAEDGDTDSYLARPDIVKEAIRQHQLGSLITICWHAVPPTADEPVTFRPLEGANPDSSQSVQGQLLDRQFKDILTPGTVLYNRWCAQVDSVALYLKKLQEAKVPILWRPYHEMNGSWFWWGGRTGEYSTLRLYKQLFDRLVSHHGLKNLVWIWSVDRPSKPEQYYSQYFPGTEYFDIASLDVYGNDFNQMYYDSLAILAEGKPLVLGEVGIPPTLDILDNQPNWGLYVTWAGMVRNTLKKEYNLLMSDPRVLNQEDLAYKEIIAPYRSECNLPEISLTEDQSLDLSGTWIFNEEKSTLDNGGVSRVPVKMKVSQIGNVLIVEKTILLEYLDPEIRIDTLHLDGTEMKSELWNSPMVITAKFTENGDSIQVNSIVTFKWGDRVSETITNESWSLKDIGGILSIEKFSSSMWGERNITMIYDRLLIE